MTPLFYIKVKVGKFFANVCSMFVRNREKRHRLRNRLDPLNPERCIRYLERHYTQQPAIAEYEGDTLQNPVWVCWLQGLEQAPTLVQNCVSSIRRNLSPDQQLIIVTASLLFSQPCMNTASPMAAFMLPHHPQSFVTAYSPT
jgi:hypothetical protein